MVLLATFLPAFLPSALAQSSRDLIGAAAQKQRAAAALQREAVRKQQEEPLRLPALLETAAEEPLACDPIADAAVAPIIDGAAKAQKLEPQLLRAVIQQESAFYPCAVSSKGAKGLMQLMPVIVEQFAVGDPFDAKASVEAGAKYLKQLMEKYKGDLSLTLGAYNAGPTAVDEAKGIPDIPETRNYVDAILTTLGKKPPPTRTDPPHIPTPKPIEN
jgi:soluble lytic murein transglycosylase-like protein